jgi:hypothetical protein
VRERRREVLERGRRRRLGEVEHRGRARAGGGGAEMGRGGDGRWFASREGMRAGCSRIVRPRGGVGEK